MADPLTLFKPHNRITVVLDIDRIALTLITGDFGLDSVVSLLLLN